MTGIGIHNNTITVRPWTDQAAAIHGPAVEAAFRINIFILTNSAIPLRVTQPHDHLRFENNLYWREDEPMEILYYNQRYSTLDSWRESTGQE